MRNDEILGLSGAAVLDRGCAAREAAAEIRRPPAGPLQTRRELPNDFVEDDDTAAFLRRNGRGRRIRRGLIPQTRNGRIAAGAGVLLGTACLCYGAATAAHYLTTDQRFRIPSSAAIELEGNTHLSRAQLLTVFGEEVDRNIFRAPLTERKAQLEQTPWVEHATVMRFLPNRLRVHVVERTPVAFTRQGETIGLVDANGVLLDIPPDAPGNPSYSFPVVTGLRAEDTLALRAARMRMYTAFLRDLDSEGSKISTELSEVDLSDLEDVKALIPDHSNEVLVHFGSENFLSRYRRFKEHVDEWRTQYPRLSSVDMRYERQVVLQMPSHDAADGVSGPDEHAIAPAAHAIAHAANAAGSGTHTVIPIAQIMTPVPHTLAAPQNAPAMQAPAAANNSAAAVGGSGAPSVKPVAPKSQTVHAGKGNATTTDRMSADTAKKVKAIQAWMAKREKSREANKTPTQPQTPN